MRQIVPAAIESYVASLVTVVDPVLASIEAEGAADQLPLIDRSVGTLLEVLARAVSARRILEIGTAIGYSGIWLARALPPGGLLLSIENNPERAARARANFARAGVADRASVMVGDAARLVSKVSGPFDLIFNDGDKLQYEPLLDRLVDLLRPGGLLVTDNVLWSGDVVPGFARDPENPPDSIQAIASYNRRLAADARLRTAVVPLRDGVAIAVRRAEGRAGESGRQP
jgi:predicted O-methyltransferase YrrM